MKPLVISAVLLVLVAACGDAGSPATKPAPTAAPATTSAAAPTSTVPASAATTASAVTTTTVAETTTTTTIDPDAPVVVELVFSGGEVAGPDRVEVDKGAQVSVVVTSDVADEIHVHGYDIFADVAAGATVSLEFEASIQGIFEVEFEDSRTELFELVVS